MRWEQKLQHATLSDVGLRRQNNEDSYAARLCTSEEEFNRRGHLFVVADGMGGHAVGEIASQIAVESIPADWVQLPGQSPADVLHEALSAANHKIHEQGLSNPEYLRMGTTCTALALTPTGAYVGHVGDSRCYRIRKDRIDQLTFDHSLHWEIQRESRRTGTPMELPEHRNIITRSLGPEAQVKVDIEGPFMVLPGDIFLLCSDGLSGELSDEEIGGITAELSPAQACRTLVHLANIRGGSDNCTVTIVRIGELPANVPPPELPIELQPPRLLDLPSLIAGVFCLALIILGVVLLASERTLPGAVLLTSAGMSLSLLVARWWFLRKKPPEEINDLSQTTLWRPYRTAISLRTQELFEMLSGLETQITRIARDEEWDVSWSQHATALQAAVEAKLEQRYAKGLRDVTNAIDLLMAGLYANRKIATADHHGSPRAGGTA